jgi:formate C-acetyltransferase
VHADPDRAAKICHQGAAESLAAHPLAAGLLLPGHQGAWNNEFTAWTTGTPWDFQFNEISFYIVPETFSFLQTFRSSFRQVARRWRCRRKFWEWSLPERRAWFVREVMVHYLPKELCGGPDRRARFNILSSACFSEKEARERDALVYGPKGCRAAMLWLHNHGYGNSGATSGHLVPGYGEVIAHGWKGIHAGLERHYQALSPAEKQGAKGAQLRAMLTAASLPRELAAEYSRVCSELAVNEPDERRQAELAEMAAMLQRIPWEPPHTFWEAVQTLWLTHMLVMSDEGYPAGGFLRAHRPVLAARWQHSIEQGMPREFGKEILKCFWMHCNTAYDAMIRTGGNQGITAGYGQLLTLSAWAGGDRFDQ